MKLENKISYWTIKSNLFGKIKNKDELDFIQNFIKQLILKVVN